MWEKLNSSVVKPLHVVVTDNWLTGVKPDIDFVVLNITSVVDGIGLVIGLDDVEIWLWGDMSKEDNIASGLGIAGGISVDSESWEISAEEWGLEGVVDLEGSSGGIEVGVLGSLALVVGWLLWVLNVHLLIPGSHESSGVEIDWGEVVADNGIGSDVVVEKSRD